MFRKLVVLGLLFWVISAKAAIVIGNPEGRITLIEVFDYQCPHCQRLFPVIERLIDQYPDLKVRLMPVAMINRQSLLEASMAFSAVEVPGAFQAFHRIAFTSPGLSPEGAEDFLKSLHLTQLERIRFDQHMHDNSVKVALQEGVEMLKQYHATGVPLLVIYKDNEDAIVLKGEQSFSNLNAALKKVAHD